MKYKLFFTTILYTATSFAQVPINGLIRYYPFCGNANDFSSSIQHGTVTGATLATDRFGNMNAAYSFNGTTSNYITIPNTNLNMDQYSYSAWVYLNSLPAIGNRYWVLSIGSATGDQFFNYNNNYTIGTPNGNGWGSGGYNSTTPHGFIYQYTIASLDQWYHLVETRSASASVFYVNDVLVDSVAVSSANTPFYGTGTLIGKIGIRFDNTNPFLGKIDDIRIYNRTLSSNEVTALFNESEPNATITPAGPFCATDPVVTLTAKVSGGIWSGTGITDPVNGIFDPSVGTGTHIIQYSISEEGCNNKDSIVIEVLNFSKAKFKYEEVSCANQIKFINLSSETLFNSWNFGDGTTSNENHPSHTYSTDGDYTVMLIVNPGSTCADTAQTVIPYKSKILSDTFFIPNVFSPNGDGKNDYFEIIEPGNPCLNTGSLIVFNRWGKKVFETDESPLKWDGTKNGNLLANGIYFYTFEGKGFKSSGSVTLLR